MLQMAFTVLLVCMLVAAVVSCAVMAAMRIATTRTLGREAGKLGLRFSAGDPFDVPRRYAGFALIGAGHSPRANNVTHGWLVGRAVQAFDFRYEVGHGTRRVTRHYSVIAVETAHELPNMLMWNRTDAESAPLQARLSDASVAVPGDYGGDELRAALEETCAGLIRQGVSMEARSTTFMVFAPAGQRGGGYAGRLAETVSAVGAMDATAGRGSEVDGGIENCRRQC